MCPLNATILLLELIRGILTHAHREVSLRVCTACCSHNIDQGRLMKEISSICVMEYVQMAGKCYELHDPINVKIP